MDVEKERREHREKRDNFFLNNDLLLQLWPYKKPRKYSSTKKYDASNPFKALQVLTLGW